MRVLVACEFSGIVRDAFIAGGHDALSCDLLESERPGPHYRGDVRDILGDGWDMMIAHPPCTRLCASGARWWKLYPDEQRQAIELVRELLAAPVPRIAIENPVGILSKAIRRPDQIVQPWYWGDGEMKTTCLWLKNLPILFATNAVIQREQRVWRMGQSKERWKERSRTYPGFAAAMAAQWNY